MLLAGGRSDQVSIARRLSSRVLVFVNLLHAPRIAKMQAERDTIQPISGLESAKL